MIILLKMPKNKLSKGHHVTSLSVQKGPTCWYYAARMAREFHHMTYHWNQGANQELEQKISAVRKYETKFDQIFKNIGNRALKPPEAAKLKGILDDLMPTKMPDEDWEALLKEAYAKDPKAGHRTVSDLIYAWNRTRNLGVATSEDIWSKYGFRFQDADMTANTLSLRIWSWGPLLASGAFCSVGKGASISLAGKATVSLTKEFRTDDHVITLCGVGVIDSKSVIFYHDPNDPEECCAMEYDAYQAQRNKNTRLAMLTCGEFNCKHVTDSYVIINHA
jgi:hypothetical protein